MFDFGSGELVVIGVVALVAIGPKELPGLLRTVGQAVGKLRRMAGDFQNQFNEALREADMADAQKMISDIKTDFSSTMSGSGAMSPPIVMPTSEPTSVEPSASDDTAKADETLGLTPIAEAEPVADLVAHTDEAAVSSTTQDHDGQAKAEQAQTRDDSPKSQAGVS